MLKRLRAKHPVGFCVLSEVLFLGSLLLASYLIVFALVLFGVDLEQVDSYFLSAVQEAVGMVVALVILGRTGRMYLLRRRGSGFFNGLLVGMYPLVLIGYSLYTKLMFGMPEDGSGVGHAGRRGGMREPAHAGELSGDRCGRIAEIARLGVGKVRDDAHHLHARNGREEVVDRAHLDGQEAQTVHARVHLDVNLHLTQLETLENVDLPHGVDDRLDVKVLKRLDVRFIEEALQKQHALVPARAARAFGVAQVDGRKAVRIGEGLDGILKTVAVGIGLHHSHQLTALRHSRLQYGGIMDKARQVQLNIGTLCLCKVFLLYSKAPPQRSHRKAK